MLNDESAKIAEELRPILSKKRCIAWIGSGLSEAGNFPGLIKLIKELCSKCGVEVPERIDADNFMDIAEACKERNITVYQDTLEHLFNRTPGLTRFAFFDLLRLPFKCYITTNYDPLLSGASARVSSGRVFYYNGLNAEMLGQYKKPIFYIHGHAGRRNPESEDYLVLSRSEFNRAYDDPGVVRSFLKQLLRYHDVIFFGCTLKELHIIETFKRVREIISQIEHQENSNTRYALLPKRYMKDKLQDRLIRDTSKEEAEDMRFETMGIKTYRYDLQPGDEEHGEVEGILKLLCDMHKVDTEPKYMSGRGEEI